MKSLFLAVAVLATGLAFADVAVDGKIPAGNVIVEGIEGTTVRLRQDMRDSNNWFYQTFQYYPRQWDEFLERHAADRGKVFGSLAYSTADDFPWGFGWNCPKNTDLAVVDLVPGATLTVSEGPMQDPVYGSAWVGAYAADGFAIVQEAEK